MKSWMPSVQVYMKKIGVFSRPKAKVSRLWHLTLLEHSPDKPKLAAYVCAARVTLPEKQDGRWLNSGA